MQLSILIPTVKRHTRYLINLIKEFNLQSIPYAEQVEILIDYSEIDSIGEKRNRLLDKAKGKYIAFFDSDDWPSKKYIQLIMEGINKNVDCCSLRGIITVDGSDPQNFEHSIKYDKWETVEGEIKYLRFPNHLNCLKASIAKRFKFPEKNFSEDFDWSTMVHESKLIKTEYYIPETIYHYKYLTKNKMKYSQSDEQLFIEDYFSSTINGKFIDIGAYDVFKFSNVRALFEAGWGGIMIEPAPANFKAIADHYAKDERVTVLNIAIGEVSGEIDFYDCGGDAISTTDETHKAKWEAAGVNYTKIKVPQVSVVHFMNEYCKDVDFLSIDTEATNMIVFRNIPDWVWEQIKMLCIEHDGFQEEIETALAPYGFKALYTNSENIILAK